MKIVVVLNVLQVGSENFVRKFMQAIIINERLKVELDDGVEGHDAQGDRSPAALVQIKYVERNVIKELKLIFIFLEFSNVSLI